MSVMIQKPYVVVSYAQVLPKDAASPLAVPYDKVIEIKESGSGKELERKIHFLEREEITLHATFFPALMVYELTKGKSMPPPEPASG